MSRTLVIGTVLAALGAGMLSPPALARVDTGDRAAQVREQTYAMWQRGRMGDGLYR